MDEKLIQADTFLEGAIIATYISTESGYPNFLYLVIATNLNFIKYIFVRKIRKNGNIVVIKITCST